MSDNKKKKYRVRISVILSFVIIAAVIIILLPFDITRKFDENEYNYDLDTFIELSNIPVFSQETDHTCYAVSMVIAMYYLGSPTVESEFIEELGLQDRDSGMIPNEWITLANQAFNPIGYSVTQLNPMSETEILNIVTESLFDDLPVIFYYSAVDDWHKPNYGTHYSVIFGIDMTNETIKISNPYGYLEDLSFVDFFDGLTFRSYKSESFPHLMGRKVGYIKSNSLFNFNKITE